MALTAEEKTALAERMAVQIAWKHWKHVHQQDASATPEDLWSNLDARHRAGYLEAAKGSIAVIEGAYSKHDPLAR